MRALRNPFWGLVLAGLLVLPAWADAGSAARSPAPGTVNYVEGQASIGGESLNSKSVGSVELEPGQTLTNGVGKTEILLTPGVFLRLGSDSAVKMISPSLTNTEVQIRRGQAEIEVDQLYKQNKLLIQEDGATTQLQKRGLYDFDADQGLVRVIAGQASLSSYDRQVKIKGGHELALRAPQLKSQKFDKKSFEANNSLYQWSSLRSDYVAQANAEQAPTYIVGGGLGPMWWGPGWYWSAPFDCYTFIPGDGIFYSPFGYGFYSPFWAPVYYGYGVYPRGRPVRPVPNRGGLRPGGWSNSGFGGHPAMHTTPVPHAGGWVGSWGRPRV